MMLGYFDGACEPINPGGTAAYGAIILRDGRELWSTSQIYEPEIAGATSNNVAEYLGFISILEWLDHSNWDREEKVIVHGDSKLVIMQMAGQWKINNGLYLPFAREASRLMREIGCKRDNFQLKWIPRAQNSVADELSKRELKSRNINIRLGAN